MLRPKEAGGSKNENLAFSFYCRNGSKSRIFSQTPPLILTNSKSSMRIFVWKAFSLLGNGDESDESMVKFGREIIQDVLDFHTKCHIYGSLFLRDH